MSSQEDTGASALLNCLPVFTLPVQYACKWFVHDLLLHMCGREEERSIRYYTIIKLQYGKIYRGSKTHIHIHL